MDWVDSAVSKRDNKAAAGEFRELKGRDKPPRPDKTAMADAAVEMG